MNGSDRGRSDRERLLARARRAIPERDVLAAVLQLLRLRGIPAWRANSGAAMLPGRGGKPQLVRFGMPGLPDLIAVLPPHGRVLAIECKRAGQKPEAHQHLAHEALRRAGALVVVATCAADVERVLAEEEKACQASN